MVARFGSKDPVSFLGRIDCGAPKELIERIFALFVEKNKNDPVDAIVINGDNIGVGYA